MMLGLNRGQVIFSLKIDMLFVWFKHVLYFLNHKGVSALKTIKAGNWNTFHWL